MIILGIDPGKNGALVWFDGIKIVQVNKMPLSGTDIDFETLRGLMAYECDHIFLERAVAFKMGVTGAFNYGRGFAALEIACCLSSTPVTYVMPRTWSKIMHSGIDSRLEAKEKSIVAVRRLLPACVSAIPVAPRSGKMHDGVVDALLIAAYGFRTLAKTRDFTDDF